MSIEVPVRPDEFLLNLLEDERDVPCNVLISGCGLPARWAMRCPTCRVDHQACQAHRETLDRIASESDTRGFECAFCAGDLPMPFSWRPL